MSKFGFFRVLAIAAAAVVVFQNLPARADIIRDSSIGSLGQGFGAVPRLLTVQRNGNTTSPETACDANSGGSLVQGTAACQAGDAAILPNNGFSNATNA